MVQAIPKPYFRCSGAVCAVDAFSDINTLQTLKVVCCRYGDLMSIKRAFWGLANCFLSRLAAPPLTSKNATDLLANGHRSFQI